MTKIVVVVGEQKEIFEGDITVEDFVGMGPSDSPLTIRKLPLKNENGQPRKDNLVASFKEWTYWRVTK